MSDEYESTPYDGKHGLLPGNDWRTGVLERAVGYGNWAGPGNRMDHDPSYAQRLQERGPGYDPYEDKELLSRPEYQAVDGMDRAAFTHDHGYFKHLNQGAGHNMFGWDGMNDVREDDRRLSRETQDEMDQHGDQYSWSGKAYSQGLRGYFGGRVAMRDGIDWVGNKAGEVGNGVSNFVNGARNWNGVGDAVGGIAQGAMDAGRWGLNTVGQGVSGLAKGAWDIAKLGPAGWLGGIGAGLNVAGAGAVKLGGMAWDGAKQLGGAALNGVSNAAQWAGNGISNLAQGAARLGGQAWDGAKSLGSAAVNGVSNAASAVGTGVSNAARAVGTGVSNAASAVGNGAKAVGGAIGRGASRAWNWLTG